MTPANLKARRLALGLSQPRLAERLGVPQSTIWRWESATVPFRPHILELALDGLALHLEREGHKKGRKK